MGILKQLDRAMLRIQSFLAIAGGVFIVIGVSSGALFRYVLDISFHGLEELLVIAAFWMYFMGASYASHAKMHITAEAFSIYCTWPLLRNIVAVLAAGITFGLSALYTWWGWGFFVWSLEAGGVTTRLQIPLVVGHSAVFIGFALMTWYFFVDLINRCRALFASQAPALNLCGSQSD